MDTTPTRQDTARDTRSILVIDDHEATLTSLRVLLGRQGWKVDTAACGRDGLAYLSHTTPDLALIDLNMEDLDGLSLLTHLRERATMPPCLMISAENSVPAAVEAMRLGARDFLVKPLDPKLVVERIRELIGASIRTVGHDPRQAWRDVHAPGIIGDHERLLQLFHMLERISPTDYTVLVQGESGTGKELVARAIHSASRRRDGPFVPLNCAAIPEQLIESELFGHTRGAFSGATCDREGSFAFADGGTLFLDEVGEFSPAIQAKLLRVLQNGEYTRIGESRPRRADVRIIAATNRQLEPMVERERFRGDLFYRLNQIPIHLPPLRERASDIPLLAQHFLHRAAQRLDRGEPRFSHRATEQLQRHSWPGNVRELQHVVERALVLHPSGIELEVETLLLASGISPPPPSSLREVLDRLQLPRDGVDLRRLLARIEQSFIDQALTLTDGNKSKAARLLRLNRTTLVEKLRRKR